MCRWLTYYGTPLPVEEILFKPAHSLIDQSLNAQLGASPTNGDGFGLGWYGQGERPALYRSTHPAWSDRNLRELARQIRSGLVFAHVRASTGTPVQQTNCHPFRHDKWLWMHNGAIAGFEQMKRDLIVAIEPDLFCDIEGSTDSETFFILALTFGLENDPPAAVERAVGFIERVGRGHGIDNPIQMTVATSDGRCIWVFRYASDGRPRTLFYSTKAQTLREQYPDNPIFQKVSDETRLVVSEPLGDLAGVWNEMPASSYGVIRPGEDELNPFVPRDS
jgi:glutamine amidotransferase